MRRVKIAVSAALMLLAIAPASAFARHHHRRHHGRSGHARIERFGDPRALPTASGAADDAGTVKSFSNSVLTITLNDGSTASGRVTSSTELECMAGEPSQTAHADRDGGQSGDGDRGGSGRDDAQGNRDDSAGEDQGDAAEQNDNQAEEQNENEAAEENENEAENSCMTASLTPGAVVHEAELRISSAGGVWKKVELSS